MKESILFVIIVSVFLVFLLSYNEEKNSAFAISDSIPKSDGVTKLNKINKTIDFFHSSDRGEENVSIPISRLLFNVTIIRNTDGTNTFQIALDPKFSKFYEEVGNFKMRKNIVVVYPAFTQAAYDKNGFYYYYTKSCDTKCLTVNIPKAPKLGYHTSQTAVIIFNLLNYSIITDITLDKNPSILKKYDKVILLHNEYVTRELFDAIIDHPNVIYMYPNSLYAEVKIDNGTMTLVRGHAYPEKSVDNGFDWEYDNTRPEEFRLCDDTLQWIKVDNGIQLDCYPEKYVINNTKIFKYIRDV